jgi:hypothetical protein
MGGLPVLAGLGPRHGPQDHPADRRGPGHPFTGTGKPDPLKGDLSGYWSHRIDDEHRLVYRVDEKEVKILKARYHY